MGVVKCFFLILFLGFLMSPSLTAFINYHNHDSIKIIAVNEEEQNADKLYSKLAFSIPDKLNFSLSFLAYFSSESKDLTGLYINRYQSVYADLYSPPPEKI